MKLENKIRKNISKLIKKLFKAEDVNKEFIPGKSIINYAGRVYNHLELINLIDSSLDFWLTAGR